jgi:hypothetical protein
VTTDYKTGHDESTRLDDRSAPGADRPDAPLAKADEAPAAFERSSGRRSSFGPRAIVAGTARALSRSWVIEIAMIVILAIAYNVIRALPRPHEIAAFTHAKDILSVEGPLFDWIEVPLNNWMAGVPVIAVAACYFYAALHYAATPIVLFRSRKQGGWQYWRGYWSLVIASGIALIIYATYPVAPPRLVPDIDIVDVMRAFSQYGWWGAAASAPRGIGDATNQYAAMPSMHFGWALWCAIQLWGFKSKALRVVAVAYPTVLAVVVLGTGNRFFADVVAGGACIVAAYFVVSAVRLAVVRRTSGLTALLRAAA